MNLLKNTLLFLLLLVGTLLISQDTITSTKPLQKLKKGVYFSYDEFIKNQPSITDSFTVFKDYNV
jgi:hypothetical protein